MGGPCLMSDLEDGMTESWRPLALAAALIVTLAATSATAQTVVVTKAPPGATIDLGLNAATVGTATADASGVATIPVNLSAHGGRTETDVHIFIDVCAKSRRVTLVETGWQPPEPASGCNRREMFGAFYLRSATTLVVNTGEQSQGVWIRQGPAPSTWLREEPEGGGSGVTGSAFPLPTGLVLFAGTGIARYSDAVAVSCGAVSDCNGKEVRLTGRVGGDFWFGSFLAATASYLKPSSAETAGSGTGYRFDSSLAPHVVTFGAKIALPASRARIYGEVGALYNWATLSTTETIDDQTITVDGATQTIKGGTQSFELKTGGWGWMVGGGVEIWLKRSFAIYGEGGRAKLSGTPTGGGEGQLDDSLTYATAGFRIRLGGAAKR